MRLSRLPVSTFARRAAAALAAVFALALAAPAQADVLCGNFGPLDSYQDGTSNAWSITLTNWDAVGCTNNTTDTYRITDFRFAANWFSGVNQIDAGLFAGLADVPGSPLDTHSFSAVLQFISEIFVGNVAGNISIAPGETIYLALYEQNDNTIWGWQWNNQGQSGYYSTFFETCPEGNQQGDFCFKTGVTPVFDISGRIVGVPEPVTIALFGTGILGFVALRRRKRR